jgi:hypothetical protein
MMASLVMARWIAMSLAVVVSVMAVEIWVLHRQIAQGSEQIESLLQSLPDRLAPPATAALQRDIDAVPKAADLDAAVKRLEDKSKSIVSGAKIAPTAVKVAATVLERARDATQEIDMDR